MYSAHFNASNIFNALKYVMKMVPRCIISHAEGGNYNNIPSISTLLLKYVSENHLNNASNNEIHSSQSFLVLLLNRWRTQFDVRKYNTE